MQQNNPALFLCSVEHWAEPQRGLHSSTNTTSSAHSFMPVLIHSIISLSIFFLDSISLFCKSPLKHVSKSSGHGGPSFLFFFFLPGALCRVLIHGHLKAAFHPWPWQTAAEKKTCDMIRSLQAALIHDVAFLVWNSKTFFQGCSFSRPAATLLAVLCIARFNQGHKKKWIDSWLSAQPVSTSSNNLAFLLATSWKKCWIIPVKIHKKEAGWPSVYTYLVTFTDIERCMRWHFKCAFKCASI